MHQHLSKRSKTDFCDKISELSYEEQLAVVETLPEKYVPIVVRGFRDTRDWRAVKNWNPEYFARQVSQRLDTTEYVGFEFQQRAQERYSELHLLPRSFSLGGVFLD